MLLEVKAVVHLRRLCEQSLSCWKVYMVYDRINLS